MPLGEYETPNASSTQRWPPRAHSDDRDGGHGRIGVPQTQEAPAPARREPQSQQDQPRPWEVAQVRQRLPDVGGLGDGVPRLRQ
jgi:hypothetical protein